MPGQQSKDRRSFHIRLMESLPLGATPFARSTRQSFVEQISNRRTVISTRCGSNCRFNRRMCRTVVSMCHDAHLFQAEDPNAHFAARSPSKGPKGAKAIEATSGQQALGLQVMASRLEVIASRQASGQHCDPSPVFQRWLNLKFHDGCRRGW